MIQITVDRHHVECTGHAPMQDGRLHNLICANVSYATQNLIDSLSKVAGVDVHVIDEGDHHSGHMHAEFGTMNSSGVVLISAYILGMSNISQGYPGAIDISYYLSV